MEIESNELAPYGLVKAVMDRLKLTERMGQIQPKKERHHKLEHAEVITALLYNMLGHGSGRLYSNKNFYKKFPKEEIFGRKIDSKSFNASTLSRTLDVVSKYGPDEFFLDTAFKIAMDMELLSRELHLDSTSISFQGRHKKGRRGKNFAIQKDGEIDLTYGHSKAKRPDLIQMVMSMITGGSSGIPYWINTHSGNTQDKDLFQYVIAGMTSWLDTYAPMKTNYFVADSALYSKSYLLNHSHHTLWISRVPESVKKAKALLERGHKGTGWKKLKGDLKYRAFKTEFCGIPQRWFVVHSHRAYYKEKINFENRLDEKEYELHRTVNKLKRQLFKEKDIALETAKKIRGSCPFHKVKTRVVPHDEGYIESDQRYMALQGYKW